MGRAIDINGQVARFPGQLGVDLTVHFLTPKLGAAQDRQWGWKNAKSTWRKGFHGQEYEKLFFGAYVPEGFAPGTWGKANYDSQDPKDWAQSGEMAKWLRVRGDAGRTDWLVVLMPNRKGEPPPAVERLSPTSARVTLGDEVEVVHLGSDGEHQAAVSRGGKTTVLLSKGQVRPLPELPFPAMPDTIDQGAR